MGHVDIYDTINTIPLTKIHSVSGEWVYDCTQLHYTKWFVLDILNKLCKSYPLVTEQILCDNIPSGKNDDRNTETLCNYILEIGVKWIPLLTPFSNTSSTLNTFIYTQCFKVVSMGCSNVVNEGTIIVWSLNNILLMTFSNAFSWKENFAFWFKYHWSLFLQYHWRLPIPSLV